MTTPTATTATTKIIIVAGQEFQVDLSADNEAIRAQLTSQGFADVAAATIQKGTTERDGTVYETVEFVKKAGTKGLGGAELAALLTKVPQAKLPVRVLYGNALLTRLVNNQLTIAEALAAEDALDTALLACHESYSPRNSKGAQLCEPCDRLPAVAAAAPCAW